LGAHKLEVQILDPNDKSIFKTPEGLEVKLSSPLSGADLVLQFQGFVFPIPGTYRIKVILNGVAMEDEIRSFQLIEIKEVSNG